MHGADFKTMVQTSRPWKRATKWTPLALSNLLLEYTQTSSNRIYGSSSPSILARMAPAPPNSLSSPPSNSRG